MNGDYELCTDRVEEYRSHMACPSNPRRVLEHLFDAVGQNEYVNGAIGRLLRNSDCPTVCILGSATTDNLTSVIEFVTRERQGREATISLVEMDREAVTTHERAAESLGHRYQNIRIHIIEGDMRILSQYVSNVDLVISDMTINFNGSDVQNLVTLGQIRFVLENNGLVLFSCVVDGRYESKKYGANQERASVDPIRPNTFTASGPLRLAWTVPYYEELLFQEQGFDFITFDQAVGKAWKPPFRRYLLAPRKKFYEERIARFRRYGHVYLSIGSPSLD